MLWESWCSYPSHSPCLSESGGFPSFPLSLMHLKGRQCENIFPQKGSSSFLQDLSFPSFFSQKTSHLPPSWPWHWGIRFRISLAFILGRLCTRLPIRNSLRGRLPDSLPHSLAPCCLYLPWRRWPHRLPQCL